MIPHLATLSAALHAFAGPLAALGVALGGAGAMRAWRVPAAAAGAGAVLAGWVLLLGAPAALRAAWQPRAMPEVLLLPAAAALLLGAARPVLPARLQRWASAGLAVLAGWWLAGSPAGRGEFWRVWLAVVAAAWLLHRLVAGQPARAAAVGLALWGGLLVAGAPPVWTGAALVAAAAGLGLLAAGAEGVLAPVLLATVLGAASLGAGRLVRAGVNGVDLAVLSAFAAPALGGMLAGRLGKRLGALAPAGALAGGAAGAVALAWAAARVVRH